MSFHNKMAKMAVASLQLEECASDLLAMVDTFVTEAQVWDQSGTTVKSKKLY